MRKMRSVILFAGFWAACLMAAPQNQAKAERKDMAQELQSRFVLAKFSGPEMKQAGTVLLVQKDGIGAVPGSGFGVLSHSFFTNYKDGRIRRDLVSAMVANSMAGLRNLSVGEGVYLLRVQVTDANVVLDVQSCGACDPASPEPMPFRATVTFPFKKGFLQNTPVEEILGRINEVFAAANPGTEAPPPAAPAAAPAAAAPPAAAQPPAPGQEPARIELGQSAEQVEAAMGKPDKVVDLGAKKIYLYPNLKIIFQDGRVADVQ